MVRMIRTYALVTLLLLIGACVHMGDGGLEQAAGPDGDYAIVRVHYATDRNITGDERPSRMYGTERSGVTYGSCYVSIPRDHRMGELEEPSIWRLEFREDPEKHVVLLEVVVQDRDDYFGELAERVAASGGRSAFIFFHGYNVTFEDAARRTAQISYDLGFDGAPVFYSWPSQGNLAGYTIDESNNQWSQANIVRFLYDFVDRSGADNIFLIAHSMGNRAMTNALKELFSAHPAMREVFSEIILAAPDIDAEVFKRDIAPRLVSESSKITLYASSRDRALMASKEVHGYPRAGDSGEMIVLVDGMETIDATGTDTSFLGHSYFAESTSILSDIFHLIRERMRADDRFGLQPVDTPQGRYWRFRQE